MSNETLFAILFGLSLAQWVGLVVLTRLVLRLAEIVRDRV